MDVREAFLSSATHNSRMSSSYVAGGRTRMTAVTYVVLVESIFFLRGSQWPAQWHLRVGVDSTSTGVDNIMSVLHTRRFGPSITQE